MMIHLQTIAISGGQMSQAEDSGDVLGSRQLQDRAIQGAAWTMIHTLVSVPIAFLVNLLLANILEPEGYGRLAFLTTLITVAGGLVALGLTPAMIQFGAKAHSAGRRGEVGRILSSSQGFRLLVVAPCLTVLVLLLVDVPPLLLALAVGFGIWVPAAFDGARVALLIENKTAASAKITMVSNLVVQTGVVVSLLWVGTADSVWATRTALTAFGIGLALVSVTRGYRRAVLRPRLPRHFPEGFWRFALPTGLAGFLAQLVVSRTEVLFLQWLSTPTAVGLFALAFGVSAHVFAPAQALTGPLTPAVSGLREVAPEKVAEAFGRALRASSTIVALLIAVTLPAVALLVPLLYGPEFAAAAPALLALGVIGGFAVATGPLSAFVLARLSARLVLVASLIALVVNVALALVLIPPFGLWGAVVANGSGVLTRLALLMASEMRSLGIKGSDAIGLLAPTAVGGVTCVVAWLVAGRLPLPLVAQAVTAMAMALVAVVVGLRVTGCGLTTGDRASVVRALPAALKRPGRRVLTVVTRA